MRQPRPSDVLEAVEWVTGYDPLQPTRTPKVMEARRLAIHALSDVLELGGPSIARQVGLDHTTVYYHLDFERDYDLIRAVIQRVSSQLEAEEASA